HTCIGLHLDNLAQLLDAVHHVPLHTLRRRVGQVSTRLHRIAVVDFFGWHTEAEQEVELGDRGDLKADAFFDQRLQYCWIRIRFHGVVRLHAWHGRLEAPGFDADDARIDQQKG